MGEFGGELRGELGGELSGEVRSETSSKSIVVVGTARHDLSLLGLSQAEWRC